MDNLITVEEFKTFRKLSRKVDTEKASEAITLAQESDFSKVLGDFYFDVYKNRAEASYSSLFAGSEFTIDGEPFFHRGLKAFLADLAYSRYIYMINVNLTPFGAQEKFTQDSKGIDRNTIKDISVQAQVDATEKFRIIKKYIESEPVLFSRYGTNKTGRSSGLGEIRVSRL